MKRFFVYTTGRTGSTAICDELNNHPSIVCHQELFSTGYPDKEVQLYNLSFKDLVSEFSPEAVPFRFYKNQFDEATCLDEYITYLDQYARNKGAKCSGFKLLYNHATAWEDLDILSKCKRYDYSVLHCIRVDLAKLILSGIIADAKGVYNSKERVDFDEKILIDIERVKYLVKSRASTYERFENILKEHKFRYKNIKYEDYISERSSFYYNISNFLGIEHITPSLTDWKKMTPDSLEEIIENYHDLIAEFPNVL